MVVFQILCHSDQSLERLVCITVLAAFEIELAALYSVSVYTVDTEWLVQSGIKIFLLFILGTVSIMS